MKKTKIVDALIGADKRLNESWAEYRATGASVLGIAELLIKEGLAASDSTYRPTILQIFNYVEDQMTKNEAEYFFDAIEFGLADVFDLIKR